MQRGRASAVVSNRADDYSAFFRREYPAVLRTVYLVVRDLGRAEELAQEAFIQLFRHWKKVASYDRPDAWVRRVAIRLAMRHVRMERLRSLRERQSLIPATDEGAGIDLDHVLCSLTAGQRTAIVLHYYEDQPVDQVAHVMGCSENTVKSHLHRGRLKLRMLLAEGSEPSHES